MRWLLTAFFTSILLSCSVNCYVAKCILRVCLSVYLCLNWASTFCTKTNWIYKREFSGVSKERSPIMDLRTSTINMLNRGGENLPQFVQKMNKKMNKNKVARCCKALTRKLRNSPRYFKNICSLIKFIQPEHFLNSEI